MTCCKLQIFVLFDFLLIKKLFVPFYFKYVRAWQIALEQARVFQSQQNPMNPNQQIPPYLMEVLQNSNFSLTQFRLVHSYFNIIYIFKDPNNGYPMYYRGAYRGQYPSRIVHTSQGPITVVYIDDPYYRRRYRGSNFAYGALAGTALASTFIWPFWFPFYWC